jgi:hypothetical protein
VPAPKHEDSVPSLLKGCAEDDENALRRFRKTGAEKAVRETIRAFLKGREIRVPARVVEPLVWQCLEQIFNDWERDTGQDLIDRVKEYAMAFAERVFQKYRSANGSSRQR